MTMGHWIGALKNRDVKKASSIPYPVLFSRIIQNQGFDTQDVEGFPPGPELKMDTFNKMKLGHLFPGAAEGKKITPKPQEKEKKKKEGPSSPPHRRTFRNLEAELAAEVHPKSEPQEDVIGDFYRVGSQVDPQINPDSGFAKHQPSHPQTQPTQPLPPVHKVKIKRPKNYKPPSQTQTQT